MDLDSRSLEKIITLFLFNKSQVVFSTNLPPIGQVPLSGLESPSRKQNLISGIISPFLIVIFYLLIINDLESATFAHGLDDNDVIQHDYFGTEKIVEDFKNMNGWIAGIIEIEPKCIIRDSTTGYVKKIVDLNLIRYSNTTSL